MIPRLLSRREEKRRNHLAQYNLNAILQAEELLRLKKIRANLDSTAKELMRCKYVLQMTEQVNVAVNEQKYHTALKVSTYHISDDTTMMSIFISMLMLMIITTLNIRYLECFSRSICLNYRIIRLPELMVLLRITNAFHSFNSFGLSRSSLVLTTSIYLSNTRKTNSLH